MDRPVLYIAMYHYVRDLKNSRYPNIKGLDLDLFRQQIEFFSQNFNVVRMEDVIKYYDSPESTRDDLLPEQALLLTFDDGYIDHYINVFPILKEYGMQGSFFIPGKTFTEHKLLDVNKVHFILATAEINDLVNDVKKLMEKFREEENYPPTEELFQKHAIPNRFDSGEVIFVKRILQTVLPERIRNQITSELFRKYIGMSEDVFARELYMNIEQLRVMKANGMYIGYHGYDHYWMNRLYESSKGNLAKDVELGLNSIKEFIDTDHWVCNYPYGSYSDQLITYLKTRGCCLGLSTDVSAVINNSDRFRLPRFDCNDFPPKSNNYLKR